MIQNVLRNTTGIEALGIASILLFFACFLGVLLWTFTLKKAHLDRASQLPLDGAPEDRIDGRPGAPPDSRHE